MSLDIEGFEDDVTETIQVEPFLSEDGAGDINFDAPVTIEAVVQRVSRAYILPNGLATSQRGTAFIGPGVAVNERDRVTLGDGYQGFVLAVDKPTDQGVLHHQEIVFS